MKIVDDEDALRVFVPAQQSRFPFPFHPGYWEYVKETENAEVLLLNEGEAYMPVLQKSKMGFILWQFLFPPVKDGQRLPEQGEAEFLDDLIRFVKEKKCVHRIIQPPNYALFQTAPGNSIRAPFGSYVIDLGSQEPSDIWKGMKSNYRQVIRKAQREGVEIRTGIDQLDAFYELYKATMQRSGVYLEPYDHFRKLIARLSAEHVYCSSAWIDNSCDGAIFTVYSRFGAYVLHAGSPDRVRHHGSVKLIHWEAIQYMKKKEVRFYDFVGARLSDISGTPYEGLQRFKKGFGSELKEGVLWKYDVDPVRCRLADTYLRLQYRGKSLPEDIIDQERHKIGT